MDNLNLSNIGTIIAIIGSLLAVIKTYFKNQYVNETQEKQIEQIEIKLNYLKEEVKKFVTSQKVETEFEKIEKKLDRNLEQYIKLDRDIGKIFGLLENIANKK